MLISWKRIDFYDKHLNKKATSYKTKHVEAEKKKTDWINKVAKTSEKEYNFLLGRMC